MPKIKYTGPREIGQIRVPEKIVFRKGEWMEVTIEVIEELKNNSEFEVQGVGFEPTKGDFQKLLKLKDVDQKIATLLLEKYGSYDNLKRTATYEELENMPAIGKKRAESLLKQLEE